MIESTVHPTHAGPSSHEPFLLLDENRFAHEALRGIQPRAGTARPRIPLVYIYGPSGAGKSHLVRQFVRETRRTTPDLAMAHLTAAEFAAELAEASEGGRIDAFQRKYRQLGLLACEDIAALRKRHESQRQLVALIDELLATGGRVVLTGRTLPGELSNLIPRLVNRCHGGTSAAIDLPGQAGRASLLMHFARTRQIAISAEAIDVLAAALALSPRELLASVIQIDAAARLERLPIVNVPFAERFLAGDVRPPRVTVSQVARAVARHFGVTVSSLRSGKRQQGLLLPRQCAMLLARDLTGQPLAAIARYLGRRNHSTVIHACHRLNRLMEDDPALRRHLTQIRRTLGTP